MKRVWSSYNLNNHKQMTSKKIQSNYNEILASLENRNSIHKKSKEIKKLNMKYLTNLKYRVIKHKLNPTSMLTIKKEKHTIKSKDLSNEKNNLFDSIKVQSGITKFLNIVETEKRKEKGNRIVSTSTFLDFSDRNSIRKIDNNGRIKTSNTYKKKRRFSSYFNSNKNGSGNNDINNMVKSYLIKLDKKNINSLLNNDNDDALNKTLIPKSERKVYYNININLGTMINNKQINEQIEKDEEFNNKDLSKFLQEKRNNNYEYNNPEIIKKRTDYLIKITKINELLKKLKLASEYFRSNLKELYESSLKLLIKFFDGNNNFLLHDVKLDEKNIDFWKNNLNNVYNICYQSTKIHKLFYDELQFLKNENIMLKRKLFSQESELNIKTKEINEINELIIKYDLNSKLKIGKKQELYLKNLKHEFTNHESQYIITIQRLKEEIHNLAEISKKNKPDLQLIEKLKDKIRNTEKKYENEIYKLTKINGIKHTNILALSQRESDLNEQISELKNKIKDLKNNEMNEQEKNVILSARIENLNRLNEDKNKIIEELKNNIDVYEKKNIKEKEKEKNKISNIILMSPI